MPALNRGSLRRNLKKEQGTKQPDLKGIANIDGVEKWISAWRNEDEKGIWFSLSFEDKDAPSKPARAQDLASDEISF